MNDYNDYATWEKIIDAEDASGSSHRKWRERAKACREAYQLEDSPNPDKTRFNIFWANVDVMHGALFSETPAPDVSRRFKDKNPVARTAADVLERSLEFSLDAYPFDTTADVTIDDYLIAGLGQVRVVYTPYLEASVPERSMVTIDQNDDGTETYRDEAGNELDAGKVQFDGDQAFQLGEPVDEVVYQEVSCRSVPWERWRWAQAKDWESTWWVAEDHYFTKEEIEERLNVPADQKTRISYEWGYNGTKEKTGGTGDDELRAQVIEVWDKKHRKRFAFIKGAGHLFKWKTPDGGDADDDPLNLKNFFPYPMPLCANVLAGDFTPDPDYRFYQDQAEELHEISRRIQRLTNALKYRGVYDSTFQDLQGIADSDDNTFLPIENFAARFPDGKGTIDRVIASMPLEAIASIVTALVEMRNVIKQTIYEITGIADIARGSTSPSETLGAQQLKAQFGSMRMARRQRRVEHFFRDLFRIKVELIAEHFEPQILQLMTGIEITPEVMAVLQSDVLRGYNVDVETDSTVVADKQAELQARTQIMTAVTQMLGELGPILAPLPGGMELLKELLLFALAGFNESRHVEELFEQYSFTPPPAPEPAQPPPPDPAVVEHEGAMRNETLNQARARARRAGAQADLAEHETTMAKNGTDDLLRRLGGGGPT